MQPTRELRRPARAPRACVRQPARVPSARTSACRASTPTQLSSTYSTTRSSLTYGQTDSRTPLIMSTLRPPKISESSRSASKPANPRAGLSGAYSTSTSTSLRAGSKSSRTTDPKNDSLRMPHSRQNSAIRSWGMGMASSRAAGMSFILLAGIDFARGEHLLEGGDERLQFIDGRVPHSVAVDQAVTVDDSMAHIDDIEPLDLGMRGSRFGRYFARRLSDRLHPIL